jgi:glycosyltransferase involved in cell wall biosynthesis
VTRRIAIISEHASPLASLGGVDAGGQNVYVGEVARHLATLGYQVDVFTRRDSEALAEMIDWRDGVRIVHVPAGPPHFVRKEDMLPLMQQFTDFMVGFCRGRERYDLVHANFWMSGLVAAELKRVLNLPFVVTFHALGRVRRMHQGAVDAFPEERFEIEDRVVAEADRVIAECPQDREDLIRHYSASPDRVTIVPAGFDPSEFSPIRKELARAALGIVPSTRVLLQLGRMVPRKGVDTSIEGFARLVNRHGVDAQLLVVGGEPSDASGAGATPELARLRGIARESGVEDRVHFEGPRGREALKWYYSAADVFLTTPWYEPFGITPVEAMACGTPVLGSSVGGIKFTVRDGETGYLVPPRDSDAVGDRLADMYANPLLMSTLGQQAIQRANDLFTWKKVASAIADVYDDLLLRRQPLTRQTAEQFAIVEKDFDEVISMLDASRRRIAGAVVDLAGVIATAFLNGGKLLVCGNGGSAAEAQHLVAEFVGRFQTERQGLPAIALTADTSVLTAWSNDYGYEDVFARQVVALG